MRTRMTFFVIFAAIFAIAAATNAQTVILTPNEKGEVNALDLTVRSLMEQADKMIIETSTGRLNADRKVIEAAKELKRVIADGKAKSVAIIGARMEYTSSIIGTHSTRRPAGEATHRAAMAYFDNVNAITKAGYKLADDGYSEWQRKTLPIIKFALPSGYENLMEETDKALSAAKEREEKIFRQLQADFEEMQRRDREMRERLRE